GIKMNKPDRKPDVETESLRMWKGNKKDWEDEEGSEVERDGDKYKLMGFTLVKRKDSKEVVFAYKFKHDEMLVVYYNPGVDSDVNELLEGLKCCYAGIDYECRNIFDSLKNAKLDRGLL
ncbi:hypothetical protein LCGC14_1874110, partial [marine sediment metagenome]